MADIGYTQNRLVPGLTDQADCIRCSQCFVLAGGNGHGQAVYKNILLLYTGSLSRRRYTQGGIPPGGGAAADPVSVQRQHDQACAISNCQRQHLCQTLRTATDGVKNRPSTADTQRPFQCGRLGAVDDQRQRGHLLDCQHQRWQYFLLVNVRQASVDHQKVCSLILLLDGGLRCIVPVAIIQGFPHLRAACGVDALPYCGNGGIRQLMYPLPAAQTAAAIGAARRIVPAANKLPHSADVLRCCSAAAAKDCRPVV